MVTSMLNESSKLENVLGNKVDITIYLWTGEYVHVEGKHAVQGTSVLKTAIVVISNL